MVLVLKTKLFRILLWSLAILLTGWTLFHLPINSIVESISALTWSQWFSWFGINALIIGLGTKRWHGFIAMLKAKISFNDLLIIRQAGHAVNFITPGPQCGGEPLQLFWLCRNGLSLENALLSIGLDRFYEVLINFTVLLICALMLLFMFDVQFVRASFNSSQILKGMLLTSAALAVVLWLVLLRPAVIFNRFRRLFSRWLEHPILNKIKNSWQLIKKDLQLVLRTQKLVLVNAIFISFLAWAALVGELALLLDFSNVNVGFTAFLLILIAMRLALLLPIPGGIGTLEASIFWSFQYLDLPTTAAIALIALMRLRDLAILLFGLYCLRQAGGKTMLADVTTS